MAIAMNRDQQKASRTSDGPMERFFFKEGAPFQVIRPNTKGDTNVRVFPKIASDGSLLPAVLEMVPIGDDPANQQFVPDISNMEQIWTVMSQGVAGGERFTGCTIPSDWESTKYRMPQLESPMGGTFVKLKSKANKAAKGQGQPLSPEVQAEFNRLLIKPQGGFSAPIGGPEETYCVSCVVFGKLNGERLEKPIFNAVMVLRGSAATSFSAAVARAWNRALARHEANPSEPFQDPFGIDTGVPFSFGGLPADATVGRQTSMVTCTAGLVAFTGMGDRDGLEAAAKPMPIPSAAHRANYRNPAEYVQQHTWRHLMTRSIAVYGRTVVADAFPEQIQEYDLLVANGVAPRPAAVTTPAPVQAAPVAAVTRPAAAPTSAAVQPTVDPASVFGGDSLAGTMQPVQAVAPVAKTQPLPASSPTDADAQTAALLAAFGDLEATSKK